MKDDATSFVMMNITYIRYIRFSANFHRKCDKMKSWNGFLALESHHNEQEDRFFFGKRKYGCEKTKKANPRVDKIL